MQNKSAAIYNTQAELKFETLSLKEPKSGEVEFNASKLKVNSSRDS